MREVKLNEWMKIKEITQNNNSNEIKALLKTEDDEEFEVTLHNMSFEKVKFQSMDVMDSTNRKAYVVMECLPNEDGNIFSIIEK